MVFGRSSNCIVSGVELSVGEAHNQKNKQAKGKKLKAKKKTGEYSCLTKCILVFLYVHAYFHVRKKN